MLLNRTCSGIAVGFFIALLATPAWGQGLRGMQLFAPPDLSTYGKHPKANEGFFFVYDGLYWNISPPRVRPLGSQFQPTRDAYYGVHPTDPQDPESDLVIQTNTLDTGFLTADYTGGNRIEIGRVSEHGGWLLSVTELQDQEQEFISTNVSSVFEDPAFGPNSSHYLDGIVGTVPDPLNPGETINVIRPLPLVWDTVTGINNTKYWSIEWMYIHRTEQLHGAGYIEFYVGPRYIELDDGFDVRATGGIISQSFWNTEAENHIIAGQIGARWFKKTGRWMLSTEGRALAGMNCQNIYQEGELGSELTPPGAQGSPLLMAPTAFNHMEYIREFTPGIELRVDARYQLTRAVSFRAGWTGMWMDRIARASSMIDYTVPDMGILRGMNRQNVWVNGLIIGVDVNR